MPKILLLLPIALLVGCNEVSDERAVRFDAAVARCTSKPVITYTVASGEGGVSYSVSCEMDGFKLTPPSKK